MVIIYLSGLPEDSAASRSETDSLASRGIFSLFGLAPEGVCPARASPRNFPFRNRLVGSYPAFSPLPRHVGAV